MKKMLVIALAALFVCSCQQIEGLMNSAKGGEEKPAEGSSSSNSSAKSNYDPKASLKAFVMSDIKAAYVDPAKAAVGSSATRDMGNNNKMTVAVVGEMNGNKVVELTGSYMKDYASNTPAVVAMEVDKMGKVLKAWGGLVGTDGVELPVPAPPKPMEGSGEKMDYKTKELGSETIVGFSAKGVETTTKHGSSKAWTNMDFPYFSGVLKTEAAGAKIVVSEYMKSGAKAQLKIK